MSMESLLIAVRDRLRDQLDLTPEQCEVQPDGQPMPMSGEEFFAVHPGDWRNEDVNPLSLEEVFDVSVTLTRKAGYLPTDRVGTELVTKFTLGLYARAAAVRRAIHADYNLLDAANLQINEDSGATENGFIEPLSFRSGSTPMAKGPDWFWSDDENDPPAGYAIELRFGGARRKQVIEEQY